MSDTANSFTAKTFPVIVPHGELDRPERCPRYVPWSMLEPVEDTIRRNHGGQSLEALAARKGLSPTEILWALDGGKFQDVPQGDAAVNRLRDKIDEYGYIQCGQVPQHPLLNELKDLLQTIDEAGFNLVFVGDGYDSVVRYTEGEGPLFVLNHKRK